MIRSVLFALLVASGLGNATLAQAEFGGQPSAEVIGGWMYNICLQFRFGPLFCGCWTPAVLGSADIQDLLLLYRNRIMTPRLQQVQNQANASCSRFLDR
jgi:hypothetical protein